MAATLALTFAQTDAGKQFIITDASTEIVDYPTAYMAISFNGATAVDVSELLPVDWGSGKTVTITPEDLLQASDDAPFTDGVYTVVYYTTATEGAKVTYNTLLNYNVKYCVYNMLRQIPTLHLVNPCKSVEVARANFMKGLLDSLEFSAACGQVNNINTILASLQRLCLTPTINECYCN